MTNEERIAVECVLRNYEDLVSEYETKLRSNMNNNYLYNAFEFENIKGKIMGSKEVLKDIIRLGDTKLS